MQVQKIIIVSTLCLSALFTANAQTQKKPVSKPTTQTKTVQISVPTSTVGPIKMSELDSVSYAIGVNIAQSFEQQGLNDVNLEQVKQGMYDQLKLKNPKITPEACGGVIQSFMMKAMESKGKVAREAGEKFLAANKVKPGVVTTASGLQYQVMVAGTGAKPVSTDQVKVHYHGTLINGEVFDSSVQRGEPTSFGVTQVIPGWTEALQLMSVGSKWKLFIPYQIAYGERGRSAQIGPYTALVFEVELLDILK